MKRSKSGSGRREAEKPRSVAVIVAHPDDETLWAGGMILAHPLWDWLIVCLCRSSDTERAPQIPPGAQVSACSGKHGRS